MTFDDEFNGNNVNTSLWSYGLPWGNDIDATTEQEAYNLNDPGVNNANVSESGGYLYLTATQTPYPAHNTANDEAPITQPYTSGCITTVNKFTQTYGMFEMSAELPAGAGTFPAFWLLNETHGPPELDVMLYLGRTPDTVYTGDAYDPNNTANVIGGQYTGSNFSTSFNLFSLVWTPTTVSWYLNNNLEFSLTDSSQYPMVSPDEPMNILLNLAVGNTNSWAGTPNAQTQFPATMTVDYVRAYTAVAVGGTVSWNNAGSGDGGGDGSTWNTNQFNWNNGGYTPTVYSDGDLVTFNDTNNGNYSVILNSTVSPGDITVNNSAGNYLITGSGSIAGSGSLTKTGTRTLTLDTVNTYSGGTMVSAGELIAGVLGAIPDGTLAITGGTLQLGTNTGLTQVTSLAIINAGLLDVANNELIITYGSSDPMVAIQGYIASGYNNGTWNGPGIISSAAFGYKYGLGYADGADGVVSGLSSGQIEVKYTLYGDANLDGVVNGSDFSILAANFGTGVTNWDQGNFLFTSSVNGADFSAMAGNFGQAPAARTLPPPISLRCTPSLPPTASAWPTFPNQHRSAFWRALPFSLGDGP